MATKKRKAPAKRSKPVRRAKKRPAKDGTKRGRKPLLDERIMDALEEAVDLGASLVDAAKSAGISHTALFEYLQRAELEGEDPMYAELAARLERARSRGNLTRLKQLRDAAFDGRNWKAAAHLLACSDPEHYSERRRIELTGRDGGPVRVDARELLASKLAALCGDEQQEGDEENPDEG